MLRRLTLAPALVGLLFLLNGCNKDLKEPAVQDSKSGLKPLTTTAPPGGGAGGNTGPGTQ